MPNLFACEDYRRYLDQAYREGKVRNPNYTQRYIEQKLGLKSSGHFAQIIQGKVNISTRLIGKFAEFLGLKKLEAEYFECLVLFNQARAPEEKRRYLEKLMGFRQAKYLVVNPDQYAYFQKWYYAAVRELLDLAPFRGDFKTLGQRLTPALTEVQAKEAVELLRRLGFIVKKADGSWVKAEDVVTTGQQVGAEVVQAFQIAMLEIALGALDRFPKRLRTFSTLTLSLNEEDYRTILEELRLFRRRVLEIAKKSKSPDRVYQYNFQVFPLALPPEALNPYAE